MQSLVDGNKLRLILHWLGNGLIGLGAAILIGTSGLLLYSQYEEDLASQDAALFVPPLPVYFTVTAVPTRVDTPTPIPPPRFVGAGLDEGTSRTGPTPTATPEPPTATATPIPILPAQRMVAPTIGLNTKIVESPIVNGEWQVPKFVAGHLEGTALPLEGGNIVLSGHVQSLSSGNVFAKIGELHVGDAISLYTQTTTITYVVSKINVVSNKDVAVVRPTTDEQVTMITCTGRWLPLQRDYDSRIVVVATRQT